MIYQEVTDMNLMCCLVDINAVLAHHLYQKRHPGCSCPDRKTFISIHHLLCQNGNFVPHVANKGKL
jgi:hypothetical protein